MSVIIAFALPALVGTAISLDRRLTNPSSLSNDNKLINEGGKCYQVC